MVKEKTSDANLVRKELQGLLQGDPDFFLKKEKQYIFF